MLDNLVFILTLSRAWSFPVTLASLTIGLTCSAVFPSTSTSSSPSSSLYLLFPIYIGGLCIHGVGNLLNTYYDYVNGFDEISHSDDRGVVDAKNKPKRLKQILFVVVSFTFIAVCCAAIILYSLPRQAYMNFFILLLSGLFLSLSYTGPLIGLKYYCLGDLVILLSFGPLLSLGCDYVFTHEIRPIVVLFSLPTCLFIENILHANNIRDLKNDKKNGALTLPILIGESSSILLFHFFFILSYSILLYFCYHFSSLFFLFPFLWLPHTISIMKQLQNKDFTDICGKCGQLSFSFGLTQCAAMAFTYWYKSYHNVPFQF